MSSTSARVCVDDDEDQEPIEKLLESFSTDKLVGLLREAAGKHRDVADRIRSVADEDPTHRKIFVHGLGWDTNTETLRNVFKGYGEIEDCKAVCDKASGKCKGYGFILFKSRVAARKALKQPQKRIGNRMTACQLASVGPVPTTAGGIVPGAASVSSTSDYTQRKIYISNVGAGLDPQKLTAFFAKYGEIEEGPLGLDKATGKPRGFCLFVYRTVESAKKALEEPHKNFEGHILHCQRAIDGPKAQKPQQLQQQYTIQRNDNVAYAASGSVSAPAHLMAPAAAAPAPVGFYPGPATAVPVLNPALGQALSALLATQGAGLGLTNLLGSLGSAAAVNQGGIPGAGMQSAFLNQTLRSPGGFEAYGNQNLRSHAGLEAYGNQTLKSPAGLEAYDNVTLRSPQYENQGVVSGGYTNQQMGQGVSGRGQHGTGQYNGGVP
ncbi:hypothetical protein K2173_015007 [Erythroxylum novogranatense]|uniref:RRM domain-containing protein n=1 Tax=Erythroxylum novogranatense TaxID=1862640 RepID=A0AAV8TWA5_9ROSI|nr:hypothetical protein K2173_015007 [Erythroxylum novogranatense]